MRDGRRAILAAGCILTIFAISALSLLAQDNSQSQSPTTQSTRFLALNIYLDPAPSPLAAYQFELRLKDAGAQIVGVEGGDHPAFRDAPYYDPAALQQNRIIIAAFSTSTDLPAARTRIARLHLRVAGNPPPRYEVELMTAGNPDGTKIPASISVELER